MFSDLQEPELKLKPDSEDKTASEAENDKNDLKMRNKIEFERKLAERSTRQSWFSN